MSLIKLKRRRGNILYLDMDTPTYPGLGSLEVNSNYPDISFQPDGSLYNHQDQDSLNQESRLANFNLESSTIVQENSIDNVINPLQTLNTSLSQPLDSFGSCLPEPRQEPSTAHELRCVKCLQWIDDIVNGVFLNNS
eukprot:TRINITY_DN36604_c0_g1_i1.p1 TRINITY_DN36604_c0_g1~~TRINITY_DN36604_c0_g1_i1.p1  ORF type:complete len:137 (+),score=21.26 TRINITY_DN36604_c0_g1_i1:160-570(+)